MNTDCHGHSRYIGPTGLRPDINVCENDHRKMHHNYNTRNCDGTLLLLWENVFSVVSGEGHFEKNVLLLPKPHTNALKKTFTYKQVEATTTKRAMVRGWDRP